MTESTDIKIKLEEIIGSERFGEIVVHESGKDDTTGITLTNAKDISCECSTLILRSRHAKLILPSESMIEVERHLSFIKHSDKKFRDIVKDCYWLVDDMYKFEQISYTKEVKTQIQSTDPQKEDLAEESSTDKSLSDKIGPITIASKLPGLRFLACAECNECPLGWFDPRTKESYLYVW